MAQSRKYATQPVNTGKLNNETNPRATAMTIAVATIPTAGCLRPDMSALL
jgi:hypothetical protein